MEDQIILRLLSLEENMGKATKDIESINSKVDAVIESQDQILKIFKTEREERLAMFHSLHRHEDRIEKVEKDVQDLQLKFQPIQ